jgi:hypothetical protein
MTTLFAEPLPPIAQALLPGGGAASAFVLLLLIPRLLIARLL